MRIVIGYPAKELWPNGRPHHMAEARARKKARTEAAWLALSASKPVLGDGPIPVRLIVHAKQYGPLPDRDNCSAAIKSHLDGIADAIGINDRNFAAPTVEFAPDRSGKFVIEIGEAA